MNANIQQQNHTQKRAVVTVSFYAYGETDQQIVAAATKFTRDLNKQQDCRATVDSITESKHGQIGVGRKIM